MLRRRLIIGGRSWRRPGFCANASALENAGVPPTMKLVSFRRRDEGAAAEHAALIDPAAGRLWPVGPMIGNEADDMLSLIRRFDTLRPALTPSGAGLSVGEVELLAPIPRPARNIFC